MTLAARWSRMKRALIIGDSGGIGFALSKELAAQGCDVTGLSRSRDGLDVTDPACVAQVMGRLDGPFDTVFIAIGTLAGAGQPEKTLDAIALSQMQAVFAVNCFGPALLLSHLGRLLPATGPCRVGVLSARVGSIGDNHLGGWYSYRASKAALNQIVHGAAIELGRRHKETVIVALHPGTVDTAFTSNYPAHRKVSAKEAAGNLVAVLDRLIPAQSGGFFDYAGQEIAW